MPLFHVDVNVLLCGFREELSQHRQAREWIQAALSRHRLAIPTLTEVGFLRLATTRLGPLTAAPWEAAWAFLEALFQAGAVRAGPEIHHASIFDELVRKYAWQGDKSSDAWLAALAIEQGAILVSADSDFRTIRELRWRHPFPE